jgi:aryl-alcohol dehydrogenase-like predicted oxidoreductase
VTSLPGVTAAAAGTVTIAGGPTVRRMGFGAMRLAGPKVWGMPADPDAAIRVLREAVELGVEFIDTADCYGPGVSEHLIARALHPYPPGLVVATKAGFVRPSPDHWTRDARPDQIRLACEQSLRRLRMETLPLYQLHCEDPAVPLEESLGAMVDLWSAGKIRRIGVSNLDADQLRRARRVAPVVSVQNRYNLADRASDEIVATCEREGLVFIPWSPLGLGTLAAADPVLDAVARRHGATPAQVALAWLLGSSPAVLVIPGTTRTDHLRENVAAAGLQLGPDDVAELERLRA